MKEILETIILNLVDNKEQVTIKAIAENENTLVLDNGDTIQGNYNHLFLTEEYLNSNINPMVLAKPNLIPGIGRGIGIIDSTIFKIIPIARNKLN